MAERVNGLGRLVTHAGQIFKTRIRRFGLSQSGAVGATRIVVIAAVIGLAVVLATVVLDEGESAADRAGQYLSSAEIAFSERHGGASIEDMATATVVDNYDQRWKLARVTSVQTMADGSLLMSLNNWQIRSPHTHPNSRQRIDFEIRIRELEMERRGLAPR